MRKLVYLVTIAAGLIWAADPPQVSGTWAVDSAHAGKSKISTLEIRQSADTVEIAETGPEAKVKPVHLSCTVDAQQCKIKENGEDVSFWYNGSALVMMEMRHNRDVIIKTRIEPSEDGKSLRVEVTHIAPAGQKDEAYIFTRQAGM
jgi:hypothetical protein